MMPLRSLRPFIPATVLAALLVAPSGASAGAAAAFVRGVQIDPVALACPRGGPEKGRVVVDVPVRYSDVVASREDGVRGKKQTLAITVQLLSPDSGRVLVTARATAKGQLALKHDRVDHVHRILLSAKDSAIVQRYARGGAGCGGRSLNAVVVKTNATQTVGKARTALRGLPGAAATQSSSRTDEASVAATPKVGRVINGCAIKQFTVCFGTDLSGQSLVGAPLLGAVLMDATLTGTDFTGAGMRAANLTGATGTGPTTKFVNATLKDANLAEGHFDSAKFTTATLTNANFAEATIVGTDFTGAEMQQVNLSTTSLLNANVSSADLAGVQLGFTIIQNTICDSRTKPSGPPFYRCSNGFLVPFG
jgi:uncharacterized protein YjbI with pentapeptide repeats